VLPGKNELNAWLPIASAALLFYVAWRMATLPRSKLECDVAAHKPEVAVAFLCGFTNVMTASYFTAQFLDMAAVHDPVPGFGAASMTMSLCALVAGIVSFSLFSTTTTALLFGLPHVRQWLLRQFTAIQWTASGLFFAASVAVLLS
jgi:threonine/homoserine/homoserine lactone efflux protein